MREGFADDGTISVLTITAELGSAEQARDVAADFAEQTRALTQNSRAEQTRETLEFFTAREDQIRQELTALENEIPAFRLENDLSVEGTLEFRRAEIASLSEAILFVDRDLIQARLAFNQIDRGGRKAAVDKQVAEAQGMLDALDEQRIMLHERRSALAATIDATPEVARQQANFEHRMTLLQGQLDVVTTRRSEAEIGFALENNASGERLITLETATLPDYPITPSRKSRAMMGAVASVMAGFIVAFLLDLRHPVIRSASQMEREAGIPPVVSIPVLELPKEKSGGFRARLKASRALRE